MPDLRYTLLGEGSADHALRPILDWLLGQHLPQHAIQFAWADLSRLPHRPSTLADRIVASVRLYPCDLLFVHRDADREPRAARVAEIQHAVASAPGEEALSTVVPVVPVRMTEAWLLCDELALRQAAGNPNGRQPLDLPRVRDLENLPDPKAILHKLLGAASERSARRRRTLRLSAVRVASLTDDFALLRELSAFRDLEQDVRDAVSQRVEG